MKVIYIADDGKQFDDKCECENYEWLLTHPHLKDVLCFDENGNRLENFMSEYTYEHTEKIIVPTDEAAKDLRELARYTGYCYYSHITEAGTWMFKLNGSDGRFVKV